MKQNVKLLVRSLVVLVVSTLVCGVAYTYAVTALASLSFPHQARGIELHAKGKNYGNPLIGQTFTSARHLWGRPTIVQPVTSSLLYYAKPSNLSPASSAFARELRMRVAHMRAVSGQGNVPLPVDLVTVSGSGLDPDISPAAAMYQVPRIARARHMAPERVQDIIDRCTTPRLFGIWGEPHVNVLRVNLALDGEL